MQPEHVTNADVWNDTNAIKKMNYQIYFDAVVTAYICQFGIPMTNSQEYSVSRYHDEGYNPDYAAQAINILD